MSAPAFADAPLWYLTRSAGMTSFVLATLTTVLGIASTQRALSSRHWPRFATQRLHRNLSLLAVVLVLVHAGAAVLDAYVDMSAFALLVPGVSHYQRLRTALGTLAIDLTLLVVVTSLLRTRLSNQVWKTIHWAAYLVLPLMWVHFLTAGTDAALGHVGFAIALVGVVLTLLAIRVRTAVPQTPAPRRAP